MVVFSLIIPFQVKQPLIAFSILLCKPWLKVLGKTSEFSTQPRFLYTILILEKRFHLQYHSKR